MCVLVVSDYPPALDAACLSQVSTHIGELICFARMEQRPIAFLHHRDGSGFGGMGIRIGRYDPIFTMSASGDVLSAGLAEFIVRNARQPIHLAGIATAPCFSRLRRILDRSGYAIEMDQRSTLILNDGINATHTLCDHAFQLSEYGPFICGDTARAASRKNQSTRWPSA